MIAISIALLFMNSHGGDEYRVIKNTSFQRGEKITFRIHYGFINAGVAEMTIDDYMHYQNGRSCYKIDVVGRSTGWFNVVFPIYDVWGTYLDTAAVLPQKGYRYIQEAKYRKYEEFVFDQLRDTVTYYGLDKETKRVKETKYYAVPNNVQDMVSGYYYFRTMDFNKMRPGDVFEVPAFFEEKIYHMRIRYVGKEEIKTAIGVKKAIVIAPIMPENTLFDGENSIKAWFTDDKYKLPLKIKAQMYVGAVEVDIKSFERKNG